MEHILNCIGHELKIPNIVQSDGIFIFDENEKKYMDLESGVWCTALGHKHPKINAVIKNQVDAIMHVGFCYSNKIVQKAAKSILSVVGLEKGKCVFLCSGSEAIELSRQIAKHLTGRKKSMTLHDSYLGSYSSTTDRSKDWFLFNWKACEKCSIKDNCDLKCPKLQEIPSDISDFVFEPGSSSGFVKFPPEALIKNIVKIIRTQGGKIIINEITTGIGRTGKWFGFQHYTIEPDFVATGKGIGNGYPVSATAIHHDMLMELEENPFKYAQSHQNDPLGAIVAQEVIQTIQEDDLLANVEKLSPIFYRQLKALVDHKIVLDVRGRGFMFAIDLVDEDIAESIFTKLLDKGFIVCKRHSLFRIDPPLIITKAAFTEFIVAFSQILQEL